MVSKIVPVEYLRWLVGSSCSPINRKVFMDDRVLFNRALYRKAETRAIKVLKQWYPDEFEELLVGEYQFLVSQLIREQDAEAAELRARRAATRAQPRKVRARDKGANPRDRMSAAQRRKRTA